MSATTINEPYRQFQGYPQRCVLVIDDDPAFTLLASETLAQAGFDVRIASNSRVALSAFEKDKPDLVLLDVELPGTNGFELCATLRLLSPGLDVPIVMVTGHDDTASIAQAYQVGATDFIHKPVLWPTLPHRVGFILRARDNMRALQVSEQKNRALLQALPDTIFIVGRDGVVLEHITGDDKRNGASLVGKQLEQVLPAGVARAARQAVSGIARSRAEHVRIWLRTRQGAALVRGTAASPSRRHAADRHARYHRAAEGQGSHRISRLLRHL